MATITKRGNGFQAKVRRAGFPTRTKSFDRKSDAKVWIRQQEERMERALWRDDRQARQTTLATLLSDYEQTRVPTLRSAEIEKYRVRRLREDLGKYTLATLSPEELANWRDMRLQLGISPATVSRELTTLSSAYTWAQKDRFIDCENPVKKIRRPPEPKARNRRLSEDEERLLMEAMTVSSDCTNSDHRRNMLLAPIVQYALETAMRRGEILALRWEDVHLGDRVAHLPLTKNGHARDVPLSARAIEILRAVQPDLQARHGRVFSTTESAVKQAFERATSRARRAYEKECKTARRRADPRVLKDLHFHDLRHEATSRLGEKLPNLIELASVTGHRDLRSLKRYYHPKASQLALKLRGPEE